MQQQTQPQQQNTQQVMQKQVQNQQQESNQPTSSQQTQQQSMDPNLMQAAQMQQVVMQQAQHQPQDDISQQQIPASINMKYKTQKCRHFENQGNCFIAESCHFAHGDEELREPGDPIPEHLRIQAMKRVPTGHHQNPPMGGGGGHSGNIGGAQRGGMYGGGNNFNQNQNYQQRNNFGDNQNRRGNYQNNYRGGGSGRGGGGANYYYANGGGRGGSLGGGAGGMMNNNFQGGGRGGGNMGQGMNSYSGGGGRGGNMFNNQGGNRRGGNDFGGMGRGGFQGGGGGSNMSNYKTIKCRYFDSGKTCPYQNKCSYAHGQEELRESSGSQGGYQGGGGGRGGGGMGGGSYNGNSHMNGGHQSMQGTPQQMAQYPAYAISQGMFIQPNSMDQQNPNQVQARYGMNNQDGNQQQNMAMVSPQFMVDPSMIQGFANGNNSQFYNPNTGQMNQQSYDQQQQAYAQNMLVNYQNLPQMYIAGAQQQVSQSPGAMRGVSQTQIVINTQQEGSDGQQVPAQRRINIMIFQGTQDVHEQIKMASDCCDQGKIDQGLHILTSLQVQGKIQMQDANPGQQNGATGENGMGMVSGQTNKVVNGQNENSSGNGEANQNSKQFNTPQ